MTPCYTQKHYGDVAKKLASHMGCVMGCIKSRNADGWCPPSLANDFADLFAADSPVACTNCGDFRVAPSVVCTRPNEGHNWTGGFDRARFLKDCGLKERGE